MSDQAQISEQLLQHSRQAEQDLLAKNTHLRMQLDMQLNYSRDLENRLEQSLTRWKVDKDNVTKETNRCAKLTSTCSGLIDKNERLETEVKRLENRLKQYDDLPLPDEIKMRIRDVQSDLDRVVEELNSANYQKELLEEEKMQLYHEIEELKRVNEVLIHDVSTKDQIVSEKEQELKTLNDVINELKSENNDKNDQNFSLQIEINRLTDNEKKTNDVIKKLRADLSRESNVVAQLKRMQNIGTDNNNNDNNDNNIPNDIILDPTVVSNPLGGNNNNNPEVLASFEQVTLEEQRPSDLSIKTNVQHVNDSEGALGLLQLMKDFKKDERVIWRSARAMREIILKDESAKQNCVDNRIDELLLEILVKFSHDATVQSHCIRLLGAFAFGNDLFRRRTGEKGVMRCLMNAMDIHSYDEGVQLHICTSITNLTHNSLENRSRFLESGGVTLFVEIMDRFQDSAKYQRQACWAILTLCGSDEACKSVVASGGDSAVVNSMLRHRNDAGVQQFGCWAISNMALAGDDIARRLKKRGVLEIFKIALETHSNNNEVVRQAKNALGILSHNNSANPVVDKEQSQSPVRESGKKKNINNLNNVTFNSLSLSRKS